MEKIKLNFNDLKVEPLAEEHTLHLNNFSSIVCKELEDFLKENAIKEQKMNFSRTYLFFHKNILAGYVTLLMDKQSLRHSHPHPSLNIFQEKMDVDDPYHSIPALKIGRICVADNYNSRLEAAQYAGLGTIMFTVVLDYAKKLAAKVGCRVLTTHAKKSTGAFEWYKKLGFQFSYQEERINEMLASEKYESVSMFYDLKRIVR